MGLSSLASVSQGFPDKLHARRVKKHVVIYTKFPEPKLSSVICISHLISNKKYR